MADITHNFGSSFQAIRPSLGPSITFLGSTDIELVVNGDFIDFGADARDSKNKSNRGGYTVDTTGLDMNTPGTYTIKYVAYDLVGRKTEITRDVVVKLGDSQVSSSSIRTLGDLNQDGTTDVFALMHPTTSGLNAKPVYDYQGAGVLTDSDLAGITIDSTLLDLNPGLSQEQLFIKVKGEGESHTLNLINSTSSALMLSSDVGLLIKDFTDGKSTVNFTTQSSGYTGAIVTLTAEAITINIAHGSSSHTLIEQLKAAYVAQGAEPVWGFSLVDFIADNTGGTGDNTGGTGDNTGGTGDNTGGTGDNTGDEPSIIDEIQTLNPLPANNFTAETQTRSNLVNATLSGSYLLYGDLNEDYTTNLLTGAYDFTSYAGVLADWDFKPIYNLFSIADLDTPLTTVVNNGYNPLIQSSSSIFKITDSGVSDDTNYEKGTGSWDENLTPAIAIGKDTVLAYVDTSPDLLEVMNNTYNRIIYTTQGVNQNGLPGGNIASTNNVVEHDASSGIVSDSDTIASLFVELHGGQPVHEDILLQRDSTGVLNPTNVWVYWDADVFIEFAGAAYNGLNDQIFVVTETDFNSALNGQNLKTSTNWGETTTGTITFKNLHDANVGNIQTYNPEIAGSLYLVVTNSDGNLSQLYSVQNNNNNPLTDTASMYWSDEQQYISGHTLQPGGWSLTGPTTITEQQAGEWLTLMRIEYLDEWNNSGAVLRTDGGDDAHRLVLTIYQSATVIDIVTALDDWKRSSRSNFADRSKIDQIITNISTVVPTTAQTESLSNSVDTTIQATGLTSSESNLTGTGTLQDIQAAIVTDLTSLPATGSLSPLDSPPPSPATWTLDFPLYRGFTANNINNKTGVVELSYDHSNNISGVFMLTSTIGVMFTDVLHDGNPRGRTLNVRPTTQDGSAAQVPWDTTNSFVDTADGKSYVLLGDIRLDATKSPREIIYGLLEAKENQNTEYNSSSTRTWDFIVVQLP